MLSVIFAAIADGFLAQKQSAVLLLFNRDKRSGVPAFSDADIERNGDTAFGGDKSVCFHFGFLLSVFFDLDPVYIESTQIRVPAKKVTTIDIVDHQKK